jgi:hypothetical protein
MRQLYKTFIFNSKFKVIIEVLFELGELRFKIHRRLNLICDDMKASEIRVLSHTRILQRDNFTKLLFSIANLKSVIEVSVELGELRFKIHRRINLICDDMQDLLGLSPWPSVIKHLWR